MSDKNFDTDETVQNILNAILHAPSTKDAMKGLTAASVLEPKARVYIADKIEKTMFVESVLTPESVKFLRKSAAVVTETRKNNPSQMSDLQDKLEGFDGVNALIKFVSENKGDAAGVLVKSYVEEVGKLSDEEYALPENLIKAFCAAIKKSQGITPGAPKTNPFRQKPPGM